MPVIFRAEWEQMSTASSIPLGSTRTMISLVEVGQMGQDGMNREKASSNLSWIAKLISSWWALSKARFLYARALILILTAWFLYLLSQKCIRWHLSKYWKILLFFFMAEAIKSQGQECVSDNNGSDPQLSTRRGDTQLVLTSSWR